MVQNGYKTFTDLAWLVCFNDVPALSDNNVFHFVSTWLLDQYTMDEVTKYSVNTRPREVTNLSCPPTQALANKKECTLTSSPLKKIFVVSEANKRRITCRPLTERNLETRDRSQASFAHPSSSIATVATSSKADRIWGS